MKDLNWLVSVDDHVIEPADLWQSRIAAKHRDQAPRLVRSGAEEYWLYEGRKLLTPGLSAAAGKSRQEFSPNPVTYEEMRLGCYDPVARLQDMDRAGILASVCFPSLPRFCGQLFYEASDRGLALECIRAYNDFMIDEWCASAPGRYIPLIIIPLWDPRAASVEMERCAGRGVHAFCFSENPAPLGLPTVHNRDRFWDPVWETASETEMVVCMHVGSSSHLVATSDEAPDLVTGAWGLASNISGCMVDWLFSGVLQRFPRIKIALAEGNIGWIPYFLERSQQIIDRQRYWAAKGSMQVDLISGNVIGSAAVTGVDWDNFDVRQLFRDHIYGCFFEDFYGLRNLDIIGVDNVMIETDYPHSDSTWPDCIALAHKQLVGHPEEDVYKVLRGNAERLFQFTPAEPPMPVPPILAEQTDTI